MNGGPSGFHNAPVTRAFVVASGLFTVFFGIQGRSSKLGLSYLDIFGKFRLWKLIVSSFAFSSTPELMFGLYLLYYFRVFERQIGSNKYSVFILYTVTVSLLFEILALAILKASALDEITSISYCWLISSTGPSKLCQVSILQCRQPIPEVTYMNPAVNLVTSGPYGLIFASFVPFFFDIPISTRFRVFGVRFSDKSFIYLAGLQLLLSSWKRSILPGIFGIICGSLYHLNVFCIRKAKFPEFIASFLSRLSWPSMGTPPAAPSRNVVGNAPPFTARQVERNIPSSMPSATEPTEDSIATLVSMGFDRSSARQALVQARNDITAATNILLEAQAH